MIMVFSPFDFEKLCLKGGLEAKLFAFHFTTDNFQEKNRGREKIIFPFYITNGQNKSECHDFVSQTFLSHFTTDIFHRKLGTLFQIFFAFIDSLSI